LKTTEKCTEKLYFSGMKKNEEIGLDFEIDKLTNSIENVITGDSFPTEVSVLLKEELKKVTKSKAFG
jgi:hypothetical protein